MQATCVRAMEPFSVHEPWTLWRSNKIMENVLIIFVVLLVSIKDDKFSAYGSIQKQSGSLPNGWSTPEECLRVCREYESPRFCYYHFTLEYYPTMNEACKFCRPKGTNQLSNFGECQCIEADGFERTVLSVNRMIPGPSIQVCENDMVIIDVNNKIEGIGVSLHWHGLFQNGYQYYDGVPFLTQCPIHDHGTFRYQFRVKNAGTHFWHSHISVHKIDGQYGSLIVRKPRNFDPQSPYYDEDLPAHVMLLSDYMHELSMEHLPGLSHRLRGQAAQNILINGKGTWTDPVTQVRTNSSIEIFYVDPGKRYRIRMINSFSTVCAAQLNIENHRLTIIAQDGENVEPAIVDTIVSSSGERVDFVLEANQQANRSYWIQVRGLGECEAHFVQQLAVLKYGKPKFEFPPTKRPGYWHGLPRGTVYNSLDVRCDDQYTICVNKLKDVQPDDDDKFLDVQPDHFFVMPFKFHDYGDTLEEFFSPGRYEFYLASPDQRTLVSVLNDIVFDTPPQPLISQPIRKQDKCDAWTSLVEHVDRPIQCAHTLDVKLNSIVEILLYDEEQQGSVSHPFHLHGHAFRVFDIGRFEDNRDITPEDVMALMNEHRDRLVKGSYRRPPGKDTVVVPQGGWVILRFKADNPGWWLFHCHFIWHTAIGMSFVVHVGDHRDLPPVPEGFPRCGDFVPPVNPHE